MSSMGRMLDMEGTCRTRPETDATPFNYSNYDGCWAASASGCDWQWELSAAPGIVVVDDRLAANPINRSDPHGTTVKESAVIGPAEAIRRIHNREGVARTKYYRQNWWMSDFNAHEFFDLNDYVLSDLFAEFYPGGNSDGSNAFVYTCKYGFLDLGHFFNAAEWAYSKEGDSFGAYVKGWDVEMNQDVVRGYFAGNGWSDSAFTAEDLNSNWQGALFGERMYKSDLMIFNARSRGYSRISGSALIAKRFGPNVVEDSFSSFMIDAGAVDDTRVPALKAEVHRFWNDANGWYKGPRLQSTQGQLAWQRSLPMHCALCDGDRPQASTAWKR
jgi:hypothetical protein